MKKFLKLLVLLAMLTVTLESATTIFAAGNDSLGIFTDVKLEQHRDENVTVIGDNTILSANDMIVVEYKFVLEDSIDYRGQSTHFQLPDIFDPNKTVSEFLIYSPEDPTDLIATIKRQPGTVNMTMEFTNSNYLDEHVNKSGKIRLFTGFQNDKITTQTKYPINFDGLGQFEVEIIPADPGQKHAAYVWKEGKLSDDKSEIIWNIYITTTRDLQNVKVNDSVGAGQEIIMESFEVYRASEFNHDPQSNLDFATFLPDPAQPQFVSATEFNFDFGDVYYKGSLYQGPISQIEHAINHDVIRIHYRTKIVESLEKYENHIKVTSDNVQTEVMETNTIVFGGSGVITGEQRSIQIFKIDKISSARLNGAEFKLEKYNATTTTWYAYRNDLKVDENGLVVAKLTYGDYRLIETKAPEGYTLNTDPIGPFTISSSSPTMAHVFDIENEKIEVYKGSVELTKSGDDHALLKGAIFELVDENGAFISGNHITNEQGILIIPNLEAGNYALIETKAPEGYDLDAKPVSFTIVGKEHEIVRVSKTNNKTKYKGSVELTKSGDDHALLKGAIFELVDENGAFISGNHITNEQGILIIPNLEAGNYALIETKAPEGYKLDTTPVAFKIVGTEHEVVKVSKTNEKITYLGSVVLTKTNSTGKELEGAEFKLITDSGTPVGTVLTTDSNGQIRLDNLPMGTYSFIETKAPVGHIINSDPITFTINGVQNEVIQLTKINVEIPVYLGSVELTKTDDQGNVLADAEFELVDARGITISSGHKTNANGILTISGLEAGTYALVETKAPAGYELDATPVSFTIAGTQHEVVSVSKVNVKTPVYLGSVVLTKTDDNGKTLQGAEFSLLNEDGTVLLTGLTSNNKGIISVENLPAGTYSFVETKAPVGYKLDKTPIFFTIKGIEKEVVNVTKVNVLIPDVPTLPATGVEDKGILGYVLMTLVGLELLMVALKKKNEELV